MGLEKTVRQSCLIDKFISPPNVGEDLVPFNSTQFQLTRPKMLALGGLTPLIYSNEIEILNRNGNSGDGSGQIIPTEVKPDRVERIGYWRL